MILYGDDFAFSDAFKCYKYMENLIKYCNKF